MMAEENVALSFTEPCVEAQLPVFLKHELHWIPFHIDHFQKRGHERLQSIPEATSTGRTLFLCENRGDEFGSRHRLQDVPETSLRSASSCLFSTLLQRTCIPIHGEIFCSRNTGPPEMRKFSVSEKEKNINHS